MAGVPTVLLLMEGIHLVCSTYSMFLYSELGHGVIALVDEDIETWYLSRHLMTNDSVAAWHRRGYFQPRLILHLWCQTLSVLFVLPTCYMDHEWSA